MSSLASDHEPPWRAGLRSARANLVPGLVLQAFALALVVSYYQVPAVSAALGRLTIWRADFGVVFAMATTGLFGGLLPFLVLKFVPATRGRFTLAQGAAITAFWTYKGFEVDLWYRVLAHFVGPAHDVRTIAIKTFLDQFVYCPLIAVPPTALVYFWVETQFDRAAVADDVRAPHWYRRRTLPVLISNLGVWLPTVCIIFLLPTPLQLPLQNLVLWFFTLLVAGQTQRPR